MSGHLITTPVAADICPRCRTPILTGWAEGLHARVDLTPLNRDGELTALLAGLQTYTLTRTGLVHRDASRINSELLNRFGPVVAQHTCGRQVPAEHRAKTAPATVPPITEEIPY